MLQRTKRRQYIIDKNFQTKFVLKFCAIVILTSIVIGVLLFFLSRGSTTVAIENTKVTVKATADFMLPFIIQSLILGTIFSAVCIFVLTIFTSHKIAGPLYRLRNEVEKLREGNLNLNFSIRAGDQVRDLASSLSKMIESLKENVMFLKREFSGIESSLKDISSSDKQLLEEKLTKIKEVLNYFKN